MNVFSLFSLEGWNPVEIGADIEFETGEEVRRIEVTFNATDKIEVWAVDPDDERSAVLVAASDGLFVVKLALPSGMCLRIDGGDGIAVFARSAARTQVRPPSCEPSLTRPMAPRTRLDPRVEAMMQHMKANEMRRQAHFEAMLASRQGGGAAAPSTAAEAPPAASAAVPAEAGDAS